MIYISLDKDFLIVKFAVNRLPCRQVIAPLCYLGIDTLMKGSELLCDIYVATCPFLRFKSLIKIHIQLWVT